MTRQNSVLISEDLLNSYGAQIQHFQPGELIFNEGDTPKCYYQIREGRIKLNHYNSEGRELILSILTKGLSVCELLLFINKKYPVNAVVLEPTTLIMLPKSNFLEMLDEHPQVAKDVNKFLAERLYYNFIMMENNSSRQAEIRIKGFLDYLKSVTAESNAFSFEIPLTRQQLAAMTGLRVETVIRTVKSFEKQNLLKIIKGKIHF